MWQVCKTAWSTSTLWPFLTDCCKLYRIMGWPNRLSSFLRTSQCWQARSVFSHTRSFKLRTLPTSFNQSSLKKISSTQSKTKYKSARNLSLTQLASSKSNFYSREQRFATKRSNSKMLSCAPTSCKMLTFRSKSLTRLSIWIWEILISSNNSSRPQLLLTPTKLANSTTSQSLWIDKASTRYSRGFPNGRCKS